jgi:hypothetical protein
MYFLERLKSKLFASAAIFLSLTLELNKDAQLNSLRSEFLTLCGETAEPRCPLVPQTSENWASSKKAGPMQA